MHDNVGRAGDTVGDGELSVSRRYVTNPSLTHPQWGWPHLSDIRHVAEDDMLNLPQWEEMSPDPTCLPCVCHQPSRDVNDFTIPLWYGGPPLVGYYHTIPHHTPPDHIVQHRACLPTSYVLHCTIYRRNDIGHHIATTCQRSVKCSFLDQIKPRFLSKNSLRLLSVHTFIWFWDKNVLCHRHFGEQMDIYPIWMLRFWTPVET